MSLFKFSKTNEIDHGKILHLVAKNIIKSDPLSKVLGGFGFKPSKFSEIHNEENLENATSKDSVHREKGDELQEIWIEKGENGKTQYGYMHYGPDTHAHLYFDNLEDLVAHISEEDDGAEKYASTTKDKKVKLNKPFRTPDGPKKFSVYVKNEKGNVVKVNFGDPNLSIKRDQPERRKNFRARHKCESPGPKTKAKYWSCKMWSKPSVTSILKGKS